jgi:hypothetical protein
MTNSIRVSAIWAAVLVSVAGSVRGDNNYQPPPGVTNTSYGAFALSSNPSGSLNSAFGFQALSGTTSGFQNTAVGATAMTENTEGDANTAVGYQTLFNNHNGSGNSAVGAAALGNNSSGYSNTAIGVQALAVSTAASENTASGAYTLYYNTTGSDNTASGFQALHSNRDGNNNAAVGAESLFSNTNGSSNTASGNRTLYRNTTGYHDTATGAESLFSNTSGNINTAIGYEALFSNTTGSNNIAVGMNAGYNLTHGANNIDIGNQGVAGESGHIRIGTASTQTATYIAGIENTKVTGSAVFITSSGQLGVLASSERYKTAIAPMGAGTENLQELRPVSFHLKSDPKGAVQYGLIAEEVAKVYPELVIRDEAGKIQGVRYDELAPMLLNEVQKQQQKLAAQDAQAAAQAAEIRALTQEQKQFATQAELNDLKQQLQAALGALHSKDQFVAQR